MCRFHIEGFVTGFGNPDWSKTHEPATQTSTVVNALVEGGATCVAKTIVDDMAFGYVLNCLSINPWMCYRIWEWISNFQSANLYNNVYWLLQAAIVSLFFFFPFHLFALWTLSCLLSRISGENKHYDAQTNPASSSRVPGGPSSGAAVAVAANLVDFSLGIFYNPTLSTISIYFI